MIWPDHVKVTIERETLEAPASPLPPPPLPEVLPIPAQAAQPTQAETDPDHFVPSGSFDPGPMPPVRPAQVPDYFT